MSSWNDHRPPGDVAVARVELERRCCGDGRGEGVFVRSAEGGFVRPGHVVAIFPGLVHHGIPDGVRIDRWHARYKHV